MINNYRIISIIYRNSDLLKKKEVKCKDIFKQNISYEKYIISYNNIDYIFNKSKINKDYYLLTGYDGDIYINIIISKNRKIAEIHTIKNYNNSLPHTNQYVDSKLLLITFKFLKKYKNMFNIKHIVLLDKSRFFCSDNNNIILAEANVLLTGDTWFGQYGFRPYYYSTFIIDEYETKKYEENKKIFLNLTIDDIDLLKYINKTNNDVVIDVSKKILLENPKMLLKDFLKYLLMDYDRNADEFSKYYEDIYNDYNKRYNGYHHLFGLKL